VAAAALVLLLPAGARAQELPAAPVIEAPADGAILGSERVRFTGSAGSEAVAVHAYRYWWGDTERIADVPVLEGRWTFDAVFAEPGGHVRVFALDTAGVLSDAARVSFRIDITGPWVSVRSPRDLNVVSSPFSLSAATTDLAGVARAVAHFENVATSTRTSIDMDCEEETDCRSGWFGEWGTNVSLETGIYRVGVSAVDAVGNFGAGELMRLIVL